MVNHKDVQSLYIGSSNKAGWGYDQAGRRIKKEFKYEEKYDCGPVGEDLEGTGDTLLLGGTLSGRFETFGGPGGGSCYRNKYQKRYYLWDQGMLIGVFDGNDNVIELFTHGPQGKFATYVLNDDQNLHYLFKDQIGSERVAIQAPVGSTPQVSEWIQNHPFGGLAQRYGNYGTDFEFTTYEHDDHSSYDFQYAMARNYDTRTGMFTGIDRAGQF